MTKYRIFKYRKRKCYDYPYIEDFDEDDRDKVSPLFQKIYDNKKDALFELYEIHNQMMMDDAKGLIDLKKITHIECDKFFYQIEKCNIPPSDEDSSCHGCYGIEEILVPYYLSIV